MTAKKRELDTRKNLAETLLEEGIISPKQCEEVLDENRNTGRRISDLLVEKGFITEGVKVNYLKKILHLPIVRLKGLEIPREILGIVPFEIASKYHVIPLKVEDNLLTVALDDPSNPVVIDNLKMVVNMEINPVLSPTPEIRDILQKYPKEGESGSAPIPQTSSGKLMQWIHNLLVLSLMAIPFLYYIYMIFFKLASKPDAQAIWLEANNQITFYLSWALVVSLIYMIDSIFFRRS